MSTTNSTAAADDVDHQGIDDVNDQEGVVFRSAKEELYQKHLAEVNDYTCSQGILICIQEQNRIFPLQPLSYSS